MRCSCPHHRLGIVFAVLSWFAALGFFWSEFGASLMFGYDSDFYFRAFVVLALLGMGTAMRGVCNCCCGNSHCRECRIPSSSEAVM